MISVKRRLLILCVLLLAILFRHACRIIYILVFWSLTLSGPGGEGGGGAERKVLALISNFELSNS